MRHYIIKTVALLSAAITVFSCNKQEPQAPEKPDNTVLDAPVLSVDSSGIFSRTVSWETVANAEYYALTIDDSEEIIYQATSYEFTQLPVGEHTVKVKAGSFSGIGDSEWSEITFKVVESDEWFSLTSFLAEDENQGVYRYNAIWYTLSGTDVTEVLYRCYLYEKDISEDDMINTLSSEGSAFRPTQLEAVNSQDGYTGLLPDMEPMTKYLLCFLATNANGEQMLIMTTATTEKFYGSIPEQMLPWIGKWRVSSEQTMKWPDKTSLNSLCLEDTPMERDIEIVFNESLGTLDLYGWSPEACIATGKDPADVPMPVNVSEYGDLQMMSGGPAGEWGDMHLYWFGCGTITYEDSGAMNNGIAMGTYPAITWILEGNTARAQHFSGLYDIGSTYENFSIDLFASHEMAFGILAIEGTPAGKMTMTKIE